MKIIIEDESYEILDFLIEFIKKLKLNNTGGYTK